MSDLQIQKNQKPDPPLAITCMNSSVKTMEFQHCTLTEMFPDEQNPLFIFEHHLMHFDLDILQRKGPALLYQRSNPRARPL